MTAIDPPIRFKFRFVNAKGNVTGFLRSRGSFDGDTLTLGKSQVPVQAVLQATSRFDRLALVLLQNNGSTAPCVLATSRAKIRALLPAIVRETSVRWAEANRRRLEKAGRGESFYQELCPYCGATIDLSGRPAAPQAWCPYCDTIATLASDRPGDESRYHLCDQCGFYSQPQQFTVFYFYFLLVIFGVHHRQVHLCHACMRSVAWKMLFGNLLFLLGVPVAISQLCRAYFGGSKRSQAFAGLDDANAAARAGRVNKAAAIYERIEESLVCCAGVRYNHALALGHARRLDEMIVHLREALEDCSNYGPAYQALCNCLKTLQRSDELAALMREWEADDADPTAATNSVADTVAQ